LHIAHPSLAVHTVAAVPAKTAHKPPIKTGALIARFIVAHIVKEAKRSPSQASQADLAGSLWSRDETTIG
jgi:hypothetical protein